MVPYLFAFNYQVEYKGELMNQQAMRILFIYDLLNPGSGGRSGRAGSENRPFNSLCENISQRQDRKMLIEHPVIESFIKLKFRLGKDKNKYSEDR